VAVSQATGRRQEGCERLEGGQRLHKLDIQRVDWTSELNTKVY